MATIYYVPEDRSQLKDIRRRTDCIIPTDTTIVGFRGHPVTWPYNCPIWGQLLLDRRIERGAQTIVAEYPPVANNKDIFGLYIPVES